MFQSVTAAMLCFPCQDGSGREAKQHKCLNARTILCPSSQFLCHCHLSSPTASSPPPPTPPILFGYVAAVQI